MSGVIAGETFCWHLALPQNAAAWYNRKLASGPPVGGGQLGTMLPPSIVAYILWFNRQCFLW